MLEPHELRKELQEGNAPDLQNRRAIILASLTGLPA